MKKLTLFTIIPLLFSLGLCAQSIVAGQICGAANSHTSSSGKAIVYVAAACPTCGNAVGERSTLAVLPVEDTDCFGLSFEFDPTTSDCGTSFDFFYTGNADPDSISFEWNFGENAFPQTSNQVNPTGIAYSTTGEKIITVTVSDEECSSTIMGTITADGIGFASNPVVSDVSCGGAEDGSIALEINGGLGPFIYNWSNGESGSSINNLSGGGYAYTLTDATGCQTSNILTLNEPESLVPDFQVENETCKGDLDGTISLSISGGVEPYEIEWLDDGSQNLMRTNLESNNYTVRIRDAIGCETEASVFVNQNCDPKIFDTISPNGDDVNDFWIITNILDFPNNNVKIYNRWGDLVYEKDGYANDWNGTTTSGEKLSDGAYFYVLRYNDEADSVATGSITIIR